MDSQAVTYRPIGRVSTPFETPDDVPKHPESAVEATGTAEIREEYEEGLALLDGFSHLVLVTHLHRSEAPRMRCDPPFAPGVRPGIFATRGPRRPNPIGLSVVRLLGIDGTTLQVADVDLVDGTPLLDLKPHAPKPHEYEGIRGGWLEEYTDQDFSDLGSGSASDSR